MIGMQLISTNVMAEDIERDGPSEEKQINTVALSISCLIFTADVEDEGVEISWSSAERDGTESFELFKCEGAERTPLREMNGPRTGPIAASYQYVDKKANSYVYQLRRTTPEGELEYFNPIYLSGNKEATARVDFGPNPIKDGDRFQLFAYQCDEFSLKLWRKKELLAHFERLGAEEQVNLAELLSRLKKGVYTLEIRTEDEIIKRRLWRE